MKPNQDFYGAIKWILILLIGAAALTWFNSCELVNMNMVRPFDPDYVYSPVDTTNQDSIPVDSIVIDTLPIDTAVIDTPCIDPIEITDPAFVTLYIEFDVFDPFLIWQGGQVESNNLSDVVQAVTNLPFHIYTQGKSWVIIIDGTNDHQQFQLKIFARSNGAKIYFGSASQAYIFAGALAFTEYMEVIEKYPSVDRFNFRNTEWDSLQYDQAAKEILNCKLGRTWADFRFNQFPVSDSLITEYQNAGWETVLH